MIGIRVGLACGLRVGMASGIGADPIGSPADIAGVTRDASDMNYYPANAAEWTLLMAAAGLATGNPSSCWLLQEPSGNASDSIDAITLGANNITLYQQLFIGSTRKCIHGADGVANSNLRNSTTAANPSLTSTMLLARVDIPAAPAAQRDVMALATNADVRLNTNGKLRLVAGANVDLVNVAASTQQWIALQINLTLSTIKVFTQQEKFTGTFVAPTNAAHVALGGDNAAIAATGYSYAAEFTGAAAELTDAQMKTLLQTLGATIPWT